MEIISTGKNHSLKQACDLLIIPLAEGRLPSLPLQKTDPLFAEINRHLSVEDLKSNGSHTLFYPELSEGPRRIALLNLEKTQTVSESLRQAFGKIASANTKIKTWGVLTPDSAVENFITEAILILSRAHYKHPRTGGAKPDTEKGEKITFFTDVPADKIIKKAAGIAEAIETVKRLSDLPANLLTPKQFTKEAKLISKEHSLGLHVLGEAAMRKLSMGGILSVSRGSNEEAQLITVEYNPSGGKAKKTIALVGKGITFDSGGISIKTSKSMGEMKYDMTGGAEVLALTAAAAKLNLPFRIVGVIAAAENLPSGSASKPGDVIKTFSGKTVEILNTDAEGRLVMCDALSYVQKKYTPDLIIDIATLTSGIIISLGSDITGIFGNNKKLNSQLLEAATEAGENFHFMPLHKKYKEELKSKVADIKNIGKQRSDAIFAALFLEEFIEKQTPWLHIDIAGTAWNNEGATGATVRTLVKFLENVKL
jgi:leucyl aminopeptidase